MTNPAAATIPPEVRRAAAAWLVELQADAVSDETRRRWQQWREAHPAHESAWQRVERFGGRLQALPSPIAHAALAPPRSPRRRRAVQALALLAFGGGTAWLAAGQLPLDAWVADERTAAGERRTLSLPDGTRVALNSGTALDLRYGPDERLLRLVSGEIHVETAHDATVPPRPFVVETPRGRLRALGTRFLVRDDAGTRGETLVAVYDGAVEIRRPTADVLPLVLRAGREARFTRDALLGESAADEAASAWTDGMLVVHDMPLADFLAELGRHRPGRLGCDPAVAGLRISGTYPLADTDRVLAMLPLALPVEVRTLTRWWVGVHPRAPAARGTGAG